MWRRGDGVNVSMRVRARVHQYTRSYAKYGIYGCHVRPDQTIVECCTLGRSFIGLQKTYFPDVFIMIVCLRILLIFYAHFEDVLR